MKLVNYKNFMKWCEKAPKIMERIDLMRLDNKNKDSAVAAYCIDCGTAEMMTIAMSVISPSTSEDRKNSVYQNLEHILLDLVFQYNDMLDLRDAKLSDEYIESKPYNFEKTFKKYFGSEDEMRACGLKPTDF